jgi:hypothetical protein
MNILKKKENYFRGMGRALADLREAQLQGAITTEAEARAWFAANRPPPPLG